MKKILFIMILMLCTFSQAGTIWYYVDTGASGNNDGGRDGADPNDPSQAGNWTDAFESLAAAEDALDGTFSAGHTCGLYLRSSDGSDDTTAATLYNWTNNPSIVLDQYDFPTDGVYDDTKYVLKKSNDTNLLIRQSNVTINKLQIAPQTTSATCNGIVVYAGMTGITINNCIIVGTITGSYNTYGIMTSSGATINNCIITGFAYDSKNYAVYSGASSSLNNCTIYGNYYGVRSATGTLTMRNTAIGNCYDDVYNTGTYDMDYMVTDDDMSASCATYHAYPTNGTGDWAADFTSAAGLDFSLKATASTLIDHATAASAPATDVMATERPQGAADDIGAFEYVAGEAPVIVRKPRIININ